MTYAPKFIIDSNILIESKNVDYGFDICPGFWRSWRGRSRKALSSATPKSVRS